MLIFKAVNGLLPLHLSNLFNTNGEIHYLHSNLHIIGHNTSIRASSIKILGVQIWNLLNTAQKPAPSLKIFRSKF